MADATAPGADPGRWSNGIIALHWLMLLLIAATMTMGWVAEEAAPSPAKIELFVWHKSLGITVLLFWFIRLGWRLASGAPPDLPGQPGWQVSLAKLVHRGLYLLMVLMPLSGWVINSAADFPLKVFWLFPLPALVGPSESVEEIAEVVHIGSLWLLLALIGLHVAAALWHQFQLRDATLSRMWWGRGPGGH